MALGTRRRKQEQIVGADEYRICDNGVCVEAKHHAKLLALIQAQHMLERRDAPGELHVIRKPLLGGREHIAYRVVRDEDGAVLTYPEED